MATESTSKKGFYKFHDSEIENVDDKVQKDITKEIVKKDEENEDVDKIIDEIGFTRYHLLIFIIAASILICGGVQELMLSIVVSMINEKEGLTEYHYAVITTCEYVGYTLASIMVNVITNYLSNKRAIQIFTILNLIFTGISIYRLNFFLASCNRFIIGFCFGMIDILIYLNLLETCPTKIRGFVGSFILVFAPLGQFIISVFCYFVLPANREIEEINYRNLLLIPYVTMAVILVAFLPFLKESARRLIALDKVDEGAKVMKQISKFVRNKKFLSAHKEEMIDRFVKKKSININLESVEDTDKNNQQIIKLRKYNTFHISDAQLDIMKKIQEPTNSNKSNKENLIEDSHQLNTSINNELNKNMLERLIFILNGKYKKFSIILWILAVLTNFIFNGIFFLLPTTAPKLNKATFKDVILSVSMEIASSLALCILIETKSFGRLRSLKLGYFLAVLTCVTCFVIGYDDLIINCVLKFFIAIPTNIMLIYSSEIYDSKMRTIGVSMINFWKRSATIISPITVTYLEYSIGSIGPYYFFAPAAIISFCLSLLLNVETRGVPLDKIELSKPKPVEGKENIK